MILKLKHYQQDTAYTCGPAALQIMLKNIGIFQSEKKLSKKLKTNHIVGTECAEIIKEIKSHKLKYAQKSRANLRTLNKFLHKGYPILVLYIERLNSDSHYAVVVGYDENNIILNDPWYGPELKIPIEEFITRWSDKKNEKKRWMMIISRDRI